MRRKQRKRKKRLYRKILSLTVILVLFIANFTRMQLFFMGYSLSEQNSILSMDKKKRAEYLNHEKVNVAIWDMEVNDQHYFEYQACYDYIAQENKENEENPKWVNIKKANVDIIRDIDEIYEGLEDLNHLGYKEEDLWKLLSKLNAENLQAFIDYGYTYDQYLEIKDMKGYQPDDFRSYIETGYPMERAILSVSYPHINSLNIPTQTYILDQPESILALVKPGFTIQSYKPKQLVEVDYLSSTCENGKVSDVCVNLLNDMIKDAQRLGLYVRVDNGYEMVSQEKGINEHQTGLAIDLALDGRSQGWVQANAYLYGFIQRYPYGKEDITGISNEPNHYRYVGKKAAQEIYNHDWTLEEYILEYGFDYDLKKQ